MRRLRERFVRRSVQPRFAGEEFNIGSPMPGAISLNGLAFQEAKKNKTRRPPASKRCKPWPATIRFCGSVLEWREVTKLKNTYVDATPAAGRSPRWGDSIPHLTKPQPPRAGLSSTNPVQNIPRARDLARAFVAKTHAHVLLAAHDIELRLMAHLGWTQAMRTAFEEGKTFTTSTARQIFAVAPGSCG